MEKTGIITLPGLADVHVHFREPGFSYKERIYTGSQAALSGGYTLVCTMPNVNPTPDSLEHLERELEIIRKEGLIKIVPYASITKNRAGAELVEYDALAPYVAGFSDDGSGVQDEDIMRRAMKGIARTGKILAAHCEVNSLLRGGYIHAGEYAVRHGHRGICSESEWREIERNIRLAAETGCRLHICHISTKESVSLIREAKKSGIDITCETAPHYLAFCEDDLQEDGRFKMNPPLRTAQDKEALIEGIVDGTIDCIATDHAPHAENEKNRGLEKSAMGVVGLETGLAASYTILVKPGIISLEKLIVLMSRNPRRIFGFEDDPGEIKVNFNESYIVNPATFKSMGRSTPFEGYELYGVIKEVKLPVENEDI